jgi:hypothetical protein
MELVSSLKIFRLTIMKVHDQYKCITVFLEPKDSRA